MDLSQIRVIIIQVHLLASSKCPNNNLRVYTRNHSRNYNHISNHLKFFPPSHLNKSHGKIRKIKCLLQQIKLKEVKDMQQTMAISNKTLFLL